MKAKLSTEAVPVIYVDKKGVERPGKIVPLPKGSIVLADSESGRWNPELEASDPKACLALKIGGVLRSPDCVVLPLCEHDGVLYKSTQAAGKRIAAPDLIVDFGAQEITKQKVKHASSASRGGEHFRFADEKKASV